MEHLVDESAECLDWLLIVERPVTLNRQKDASPVALSTLEYRTPLNHADDAE